MSAKKTRRKSVDNQQAEEPSLPREQVERFFHEIEDRAWTDAEKELDVIRQKSSSGDWSRGYLKALEGILLAFRSGDDKYVYLPRIIQGGSTENIRALKEEFTEFSSNVIHGIYDRGFFKALGDYLNSVSPEEQKPIAAQPNQAPEITVLPVKQAPDEE